VGFKGKAKIKKIKGFLMSSDCLVWYSYQTAAYRCVDDVRGFSWVFHVVAFVGKITAIMSN
jgi:hypothetical protein